jgi:hypothetical protein
MSNGATFFIFDNLFSRFSLRMCSSMEMWMSLRIAPPRIIYSEILKFFFPVQHSKGDLHSAQG